MKASMYGRATGVMLRGCATSRRVPPAASGPPRSRSAVESVRRSSRFAARMGDYAAVVDDVNGTVRELDISFAGSPSGGGLFVLQKRGEPEGVRASGRVHAKPGRRSPSRVRCLVHGSQGRPKRLRVSQRGGVLARPARGDRKTCCGDCRLEAGRRNRLLQRANRWHGSTLAANASLLHRLERCISAVPGVGHRDRSVSEQPMSSAFQQAQHVALKRLDTPDP